MSMRFTKFTVIIISLIVSSNVTGQYDFQDFIGEWKGYISSSSFGGYNDQMTMIINTGGSYTESSGRMMPTIYSNTQKCEYEASTNRFHWWYLKSVYSGMKTYQDFFYDVVYFKNDTLIMHYNYWDDPEPKPEVGTIFLVKDKLIPAPKGLEANLLGNHITLKWNAPSTEGETMGDILGYNVYHKPIIGRFSLLSNVQNTSFTHENVTNARHSYYVTTVYESGESGPSNQVEIDASTSDINDLNNEGIRLFPNPATQSINIECNTNIQAIRVYSSTGQLQMIFNLYDGASTKLNIEDLNPGLYTVQIESRSGFATTNFLKR